MVKLYGPGDPTGCGEGFSFIRESMKQMFFRCGESEAKRAAFIEEKTKTTLHKYSIVDQQINYKAEIERIWNAQMKSLTAHSVKSDENDKAIENQRIKESVICNFTL